MRIATKMEFFRLSKAGCLGNTLRQFDSPEEALRSDVQHFGLREIGEGGGGRHGVYPRIVLQEALDVWARTGSRYNIDEAAPDYDVELQGEICRTVRGLEGLLGIRTAHRMRDSIRLKLLQPVTGLRVNLLLDAFLDPSSRDDVENLFDLYPDATIELATYPYDLGRFPGRNTIIWEVRDY